MEIVQKSLILPKIDERFPFNSPKNLRERFDKLEMGAQLLGIRSWIVLSLPFSKIRQTTFSLFNDLFISKELGQKRQDFDPHRRRKILFILELAQCDPNPIDHKADSIIML